MVQIQLHDERSTTLMRRFILSAKQINSNDNKTTMTNSNQKNLHLSTSQANHNHRVRTNQRSSTRSPVLVPIFCFIVISVTCLVHGPFVDSVSAQEVQLQNQLNSSLYAPKTNEHYYYTRTREDPSHLRISEEFKNQFLNDIKYESKINGTKYQYYRASSGKFHQLINHDDLVFETIDKMFRHRLSAFYIHHYDDEHDKRRSSDPRMVSHEACARDLLYLIDKVPMKRSQQPTTSTTSSTNGNVNYDDLMMSDQLTPELSAFFDSYARQEAGLLMGNTYWTGAYDQCVSRQIFELIDPEGLHMPTTSRQSMSAADEGGRTAAGKNRQQVVSFKGRYCVSSLKAPGWDERIRARKESSRDYFRTERQFQDYSKLFRLQIGICLPDSCDSTSLERHSEEIKLLTTSMLESRYSNYELIDLYCLPDETSPLRQWSTSSILFMVLVAIWLTGVFLATVADVFEFVDVREVSRSKQKTTEKRVKVSKVCQLVCWFSLRANYDKLMKVSGEELEEKPKQTKDENQLDKQRQQQVENELPAQNSKPEQVKDRTGEQKQHQSAAATSLQLKVNLRFLNAFKTLVMFWIVNGHIMLLMIQTAKNILNSDALLNGLMHLLIGATFGVDLFFTMTGFLTSYLIFNSGHAYKMKPATWLYLSFHRYWRLAPMYLLSFWFSKSVAQLLGSGPLWDYGTASVTFRGLCNHESWWYPLTLTSNLHGLFEECMITSWYISCDMQFWLVSPVYIYLLAKSPLSGWLVTLATIMASSKLRYDSVLTEKAARYDELVQPRADIFMRVSHDLPALYTHPHYRIAAYLVGLLAGHYVYMIQAGKWRSLLSYDSWVKQEHLLLIDERVNSSGTAIRSDKMDNKQLITNDLDDNTKTKKEEEEHDKKEGHEEAIDFTESPNTTGGDGADSMRKHVREEISDEQQEHLQKQLAILSKVRASRRLRNLVAYFGLLMFLVMSFVSYLLANYCPQLLLRNAKLSAAILYSIDHLLMSIGVSLIIVAMCFGQWNKLTQFLSHPNWTRLSKINYALLLLQCEAIYYQVFRLDEIPTAGTRQLINILFNLMVTLYPVAFVVTLVFEYPLANIEKLLLP